MEDHIPQDSWLIRESLQKVTEGPQALMQWAQEHHDYIDSKFMRLLEKMIEYAKKNNNPQHEQTFSFLKNCFEKMFDFSDSAPIAVSRENFAEIWQQASQKLQQGKAQAAMKTFETLSVFLAHHPDLKYQTQLHANLGIAYAQLNYKEKSIAHLQKALAISSPGLQKEKILANLGTVYRDQKQLVQAFTSYQQAFNIAEERHDLQMQVIHLNHMALTKLDERDMEQAIAYQQQACTLARQLANSRLLQDSLTRMALLMGLSGQPQRCQEICQEALQLTPDPPNGKK